MAHKNAFTSITFSILGIKFILAISFFNIKWYIACSYPLFNNSFECGEFAVCGTRGWLIESTSDEDRLVLNRELGRLKLSLEDGKKYNKKLIAFLHYPPVYGSLESTEIIDLLNEYNVKKCYYGHIHGSNMIKGCINGEYKGIDFRLISCDGVGFMPQLVR